MCVGGVGCFFFVPSINRKVSLQGSETLHPFCAGELWYPYASLHQFAILGWAHSESVMHSRPCLPGGLYRFVSCVEAVPGKNSILLLVNWTLPPRKPGVLRFCFWNRYQEQALVLQDT